MSSHHEVIVIGGHLDSWDVGTGAIDDASGVAISAASAELPSHKTHKTAKYPRIILSLPAAVEQP